MDETERNIETGKWNSRSKGDIKKEWKEVCSSDFDIDIDTFVNCNWVVTRWL